MTLEELSDMQNTLKITQIIGLGESQRKLYKELFHNGEKAEDLMSAYFFHERELETLIKYQKSRIDNNG